jgi:saccharopine dehydrogenase (NAD+, L-lysine-forming)
MVSKRSLQISSNLSLTPNIYLLGLVDIFVNCIYLATPIPKFLTTDFIAEAGKDRRLSVVVDVSCE